MGALLSLAAAQASADLITYNATANAGVRENSANNNFGSLEVQVNEPPAGRRWSFFKFTITGNPCNLGAISVRLYAGGSTDGLPTALYSASDTTWGESTITWNNKPAISSSALSEAIVNNAAGYYVWDVTNYVRSEYLAGRSTVTLVAKGAASPPASSEKVTIASRSSTTPPQLVVNTEPLVPGCTSTAAPLADTFARSSSPDQNFGGRNELEVKFPGSSTWSYVKVPLPSVASGAVASAKLRFRGKADNAGAVVSLYGVSVTTWGESTLTWTNKPAPDASALGSLPVSAASTQWYEWNLTDYVQAHILAGHSAATFALQINANQSVAFDSRESNHGPAFIVDVGVPIYYIHVDHLNTPRLVANQQGQPVWRWDQQEPFGVTMPDENPSGLGAFEFPLRFPGQYFDKETNLAYNFHRDYDPGTGRYIQSDPIGLRGGPNTFLYVDGNALDGVDPSGLFKCFYDPANVNMMNCTLVAKRDSDRDVYQWRLTGQGVWFTIMLSKPQFGMGPTSPKKGLPITQPPVGPTAQVQQYWEIQFGYDEETRFRQNILTVEEEWECPNQGMCGPNGNRVRRNVTCYSDWVATSTTRKSPWIKSYLKQVQ
jgi:RHS repeat-associated protein